MMEMGKKQWGGDYGGEDDGNSEELCPSDILLIPDPSDSDYEDISSRPDVSKRTPFTEDDMKNPMLQVGHIFANAMAFRRAVKHANILKGKDLDFQKNETVKVTARCKDKRCKYRVYGRKLKDESTFLLASLYPRHTCTRTYKNHMVTSDWIAEWCMESFRNQPDLPIKVLKKEVKSKWNVDVHMSSLYRARKLAQQKIYGKLDEQYHRLWNYCAMVRKTNVGSCLILMVERPVPEVPCRFQRLYVSFVQ
jgi:hypothetical protein